MFPDDYDLDYARSEFENAIAISRMEWQEKESKERTKIDELVAAGRFVVVSTYPAYCPRTDAIIGEYLSLIADFPTREEAFECAGRESEKITSSEEQIKVLPFIPSPAPVSVSVPDDNEIPF